MHPSSSSVRLLGAFAISFNQSTPGKPVDFDPAALPDLDEATAVENIKEMFAALVPIARKCRAIEPLAAVTEAIRRMLQYLGRNKIPYPRSYAASMVHHASVDQLPPKRKQPPQDENDGESGESDLSPRRDPPRRPDPQRPRPLGAFDMPDPNFKLPDVDLVPDLFKLVATKAPDLLQVFCYCVDRADGASDLSIEAEKIWLKWSISRNTFYEKRKRLKELVRRWLGEDE